MSATDKLVQDAPITDAQMSDAARIAALAKSWEQACRSGDTGRIVAHLSNDATVWYNFEQVDHDRDAYRAILDASKTSFRNPTYKDFRVSTHASGFVEQATLVGETDHGIVETPFLLITEVADNKITRIEEYFDTTVMKKQPGADG